MAELPRAWVCEDGQWVLCCLICSLFNNGEDVNCEAVYLWCLLNDSFTINQLTPLTLAPSHKKRGKVEDVQRKVGVLLLNGQKLELSCDIKAVCKDVLDMVVAHIGLVEHHLFGLANLRGTSMLLQVSDGCNEKFSGTLAMILLVCNAEADSVFV